MTLITFLLRRSRGPFLLAVLIGLVSGASSSALIFLINDTLTKGTFGTGAGIASFLGVLLLGLVSRLVSQTLLNQLNQGALYALRMQLCRRILDASLRQLEDKGAHRLMAMLAEDVPVVGNSMLMLPAITINAATILGCLGYLATLSPVIFLSLLTFVVVGLMVYRLPVRLGVRFFREAREKSDTLHKLFRGLTDGIKELKLHRARREAFVTGRGGLEDTAVELRRLGLTSANILSATSVWALLFFFIFIGGLLHGLAAVTDVSPTVLTSCMLTLLYLQPPLDILMSSVNFLSRGSVALEKFQQLGLVGEEPEEGVPALRRPAERFEQLEFRGITHRYYREQDEHPFTLGPIDLTLSRGELVFLVGGNGSGKTTFGKLLTGLYVPEAGELRLNGVPVTDANREAYRQTFSAVFSDFHLFDSLLGLTPSDRMDQVQQYLRRLQLDHKVRIGDDGVLSTTRLSQGQRKRLALLTAYLEDRPFYFFDEWAADQDPVFKEIFYLHLLADLKRQGKTVLVISHDNRYFHVADRLLQLESGRLSEGRPVPVELSLVEGRARP